MCAARYWIVFSLGVAAGAAVALTYAPQTGEKTRKQLKRNLRDASDYVKDASEDIGKHANRAYKSAKEVVDDAASRMSDAADAIAKRAGLS